MMKSTSFVSVSVTLLMLQWLSVLCLAHDSDFFYLVQQWPGAYCDSKQKCSYPKTGNQTADFGIHGLWPNYKSGASPSNCVHDSESDESQIEDLLPQLQTSWPTLACQGGDAYKFWTNEWEKHGTCPESKMGQREYFEAALKLKQKTNLLQVLKSAGIKPDDGFYELDSILEAIKAGTGFNAYIECNVDPARNSQLYRVYMCADTLGSGIIDCPTSLSMRCPDSLGSDIIDCVAMSRERCPDVLGPDTTSCLTMARERCGSSIQFPKF